MGRGDGHDVIARFRASAMHGQVDRGRLRQRGRPQLKISQTQGQEKAPPRVRTEQGKRNETMFRNISLLTNLVNSLLANGRAQ